MAGKRPRAPAPVKKITRGGRKLKALIAELSLGTTDVAKATGLDRIAIHRCLHGDYWKHISIDFGMAIRAFSKGRLALEDFSSMTATPVEKDDEEPVATGTYG
jgi:hypothetical protein